VLGVQARVMLAVQARPEETRNGQPENQHYRCDLPKPHAPPPRSGTTPFSSFAVAGGLARAGCLRRARSGSQVLVGWSAVL
jgi:hypothetical protein